MNQTLDVKTLSGTEVFEEEIVISFDEATVERVQSNTVFTAASSNHYTNNHLNPDTCCGCTSN